ncbi:MAG: 50S ribosomal protein L13 [bacterium]|nr:50S ribosomal protein L13 [bacterium]
MATKSEYTIDAAGKSLGRIASQAAKTLMGKTEAGYTPNIASQVQVTVINAAKLINTDKKKLGKKYTSYSGYPGGLKTEALGKLQIRKSHAEPLRRAIERMLPRNTLRVGRMKNLRIVV